MMHSEPLTPAFGGEGLIRKAAKKRGLCARDWRNGRGTDRESGAESPDWHRSITLAEIARLNQQVRG